MNQQQRNIIKKANIMNTLIIANLILWLSVFSWFMPSAIDKQASIDDTVVIEHKLNITE